MAKARKMGKREFRNLKIVEFAHAGELSPDLKGLTVAHLLEDCGNLLDHIESHEILCRPVFKLSDGKWYTASVEVVITPADKETVKDALEEAKAKG